MLLAGEALQLTFPRPGLPGIATPKSSKEVAHGFHQQYCQAFQMSMKDFENLLFRKAFFFFFLRNRYSETNTKSP